MPRRYLFGPVTAEFANENLRRQREAGECLCFNADGSTDLTIQPSDTWTYICKRFPEGWQPDFIVLNLADATIPASLWSAEIPIVCIAGAWQRLWHYYRLRLWTCELILTDANGVEAFQRQGLAYARTVGVDWSASVEVVEREWAGMVDRQRQRPVLQGLPLLLCRTWQALSSYVLPDDPTLATDLATALTTDPHNADVHNALGLLMTRAAQGRGPVTDKVAQQVIGYFQRAVNADPTHLVAGLNHVEALIVIRHTKQAAGFARQMLNLQDKAMLTREALDAPHFPPEVDDFWIEWDRAAWANAGDPAAEARAKHGLIRWRLLLILADLEDDLQLFYEAVLARPDIPVSQAALGCALARKGKLAESVPHLRKAVALNPGDRAAAKALFQVLGDTGDAQGQRRLARDRCLLAKAHPQVIPEEAWFANAPPLGDELASIIVLCCNELEFTQKCLESVLRWTRPPYELLIVDNGSTDATPAYLDEVCKRQGPARVKVIHNVINLGYPAACNQALAEAQGQYLVFLNNDTIVTPGWLDKLIALSLHDWPKIGMVGPMTNRSRPPQEVEVPYKDIGGLHDFAMQLRQKNAGQAQEVQRLTGFCLLVRREVLDKIGGLDERFGVGFFEDDDLCVRAMNAGFRLMMALDVFVHHFGSRTFLGQGIDCPTLLQANLERFREKWGAEAAAGYHMLEPKPAPAVAAAPTEPLEALVEMTSASSFARALAAGMAGNMPTSDAPAISRPKVSLCMIVKNEEEHLPACLESMKGICEETIIVDTGSTDRTKEIAISHGAKVFDFAWVDSFAAARNECLKHATGEYIFWMDADDRLDEANRAKLSQLIVGLNGADVGYVMKCVCLPTPGASPTTVDHVRLFPNKTDVRWDYRVHEQILGALRNANCRIGRSDVAIIHVGYQDRDAIIRKRERDLRLLHLELADKPNHPYALFNLGSIHQEMGEPAKALEYLRQSLERSEPSDSIVRKLYVLISHCHRQLGQPELALKACQAGRRFYPDDAELLNEEGQLLSEHDNEAGAEACFQRALHVRDADHFASVPDGLRGWKPRNRLGWLCYRQGRLPEAEAHWRAAIAEQPGLTNAWRGLGEICLKQGRWNELEEVVKHLDEIEAPIFRARGMLTRKEFAASRELLEATIAQHPQALWPRRLLTEVLLEEGKDWQAAEQALRELVELAPDDETARRNLELVLRRKGGS